MQLGGNSVTGSLSTRVASARAGKKVMRRAFLCADLLYWTETPMLRPLFFFPFAALLVLFPCTPLFAQIPSWGTPISLSATGQDAYDPQISISSDGTKATAIWARSNGSNYIAQTASATISGTTVTWGSVTDLSATGQSVASPQIAISSDGTKATALWRRRYGIDQMEVTTLSNHPLQPSAVTPQLGGVQQISQLLDKVH